MTDLNSHLLYQRHFIHSDYINLLPCVLDINYNFDSDFHIIIIGSTSSVGISLIKMLKESKIEYVEVRNRIHFNMLRDPIWEIFDQMQNNILIFDFQHIYDEYATKRLNSYAKKRNIPIVRLVSSFLNDNYSYQLQIPMVFGPNYQRISDCANSFYYDCFINNTQKIYECPLSTQYVLSYDLAKYLFENLEPAINQNFTKPMHIIPDLQFYSSKEIMSHISKTRPQCKWKNDEDDTKKEINQNSNNQRENEQQNNKQQQQDKQQKNEQLQKEKQQQKEKHQNNDQQRQQQQLNNEQQQKNEQQKEEKQLNNEQQQKNEQQKEEKHQNNEQQQKNEQQKEEKHQNNDQQRQQQQLNNEQQQNNEQQKEEKQQNNEQQQKLDQQQKNEQRLEKHQQQKKEQQNSKQRQQGKQQEKSDNQQARNKQKERSRQQQQNLQKQKNIKQAETQSQKDFTNQEAKPKESTNKETPPNNNNKQNLPPNNNNNAIKQTPPVSKNFNEKPGLLENNANDRESKLSDSFSHVDHSFNSIIPDLSSPYVSHITTISDLPRVVSYHQIIMNTISQILPHFPLINVEFITVYTSSKDTKFSDLYEIPPNLAKYHVEVNIPSKILKEINKRIKCKYFPEYVLRNIGVRRARGVYIIAGSSDVLMPPGFFISAEQLLFNPLTIIRSVRENVMPVEVPRVMKDFNKYFYSITYWAHTDIGVNQMKLSLLCDASGDFQGCHRLMWEAVNGYVESNLIFNVDSAFEFDLCRLLTPIMIRFLPGEKHLIHTKISTSTQHLHLLDLYNRFFAYNGWMSWHDNYRPNWGHGTLNDLL